MRFGKHLLFFMTLALLVLPFSQRISLFVKEPKLEGFFQLVPPPSLKDFTWERWFSGTFQELMNAGTKDYVGFRNTLFRLHNEYDYRLYGITHAKGFIEGKQSYLFEEDYILEYLGRYFIGPEILENKLQKLEQVSHDLREAGIPFVLVLEPGKASFYPEHIPDHYRPDMKSRSNYDYIIQRSEELQIPTVNLNRYFLAMKDTCPYPLFSKYGMHWSIYGSVLAMDTLFRYIETMTQTDLPGMTIPKLEISDSMRWTDKDIEELLNLVFPVSGEQLAYPALAFDTATPRRLSILVIADSYYVNIIHNSSGQVFETHEYWYYNSKLYPHIIDNQEPVYVNKTNLKEKLLSFDMVLLMVSEINLHCGFWNFADEAYVAFHPDYQDPPWYPYQNNILNNREWFNFMVKKARTSKIPTGDAIIRDAKYIYNSKNR